MIVNIVDASLSDTDNSSHVTFTFSEKVSDATVGDTGERRRHHGCWRRAVGAGLERRAYAATATFTATDSSTTAASVTVNANAYTDVAGNLGSSGTDTARSTPPTLRSSSTSSTPR